MRAEDTRVAKLCEKFLAPQSGLSTLLLKGS
jgi:hypothetical protein